MLADALHTLGFQAPVAIANLFNFVLIVLVVHFGFHKTIQRIVTKRQAMAQQTIDAHKKAQVIESQTKKEATAVIQIARLEAASVAAEASARAERIVKISEERSIAQSQLMIERARQQIVKEQSEMGEVVRAAMAPKIAKIIMSLAGNQSKEAHKGYTSAVLSALQK